MDTTLQRVERTRKELLELSPEDEKEITRFIECVKLGEGLQNPTDDPAEKNNVFKEVTFSLSRAEILKSLFVYSGISIEEFTNKIMKLCGFRWHIPFLLRETETFQREVQKKLQTDLLQPLNHLAAGFTCPHLLRRFLFPIKSQNPETDFCTVR